MPLDAEFGLFERDRRFGSIFGEHGEARLRIEDRLRQGFEREQTHGLLLQLLDGRLAVLAGGREDLDHGTADGVVRVQSTDEERKRNCGRMRDDVYGRGIRVERFRRFQHWRT